MSPQAGTTRDVLESALDISGYPVVIRYVAILTCTRIELGNNMYCVAVTLQDCETQMIQLNKKE